MRERRLAGSEFQGEGGANAAQPMSFYEAAKVAHAVRAEHAGNYRNELELRVKGEFDFDSGRCNVTFHVDSEQRFQKEFDWKEDETYRSASRKDDLV